MEPGQSACTCPAQARAILLRRRVPADRTRRRTPAQRCTATSRIQRAGKVSNGIRPGSARAIHR